MHTLHIFLEQQKHLLLFSKHQTNKKHDDFLGHAFDHCITVSSTPCNFGNRYTNSGSQTFFTSQLKNNSKHQFYKETHYEGSDFIIVVGSSPWKWRNARQYCKNALPTFYDDEPSDLYSINSWDKQSAVSKVAFENSIETKAWIGFTDELSEGTWYWLDEKPENGFSFWRSRATPPTGTGKHTSIIRFDLFGYGWDPISKVKRANAIICSHRWVLKHPLSSSPLFPLQHTPTPFYKQWEYPPSLSLSIHIFTLLVVALKNKNVLFSFFYGWKINNPPPSP